MKNTRSRYFEIILYLEDDPNGELIKYYNDNYNILYVLHDKDVYEENTEDHIKGEIKKEHYHVLFTFQNARYKNAFIEEINYRENLCTPISNLNRFLLYMIHYGEDEKAQYSIDNCYGSPLLIDKLKKLINKEDGEEKQVTSILDYINEATYIISLEEMLYFCLNNNLWSTWRRNYNIFKTYLFNHNVRIENKQKFEGRYKNNEEIKI